MKRFLLFVLLATVAGLTKAQHTFFVKQSAAGDGSSWTSAAGDLQATINQAAEGDSVFVAGGVYQPASGQSFSMKQGVKIYGSFAGTELNLTGRNLAGGDTSILMGNGMSVLDNQTAIDASSVLDGFKITGGYANTGLNGGHGGGGIYNQYASPTLSHLVITGNGCNYYGGGIESATASPVLENVIIKDNTASNGGGGIFFQNSSPTLRNVLICGNSALEGGGIWGLQGSMTLTNVTITGNTATEGGGIYTGVPLDIYNSIIWGNNAGGNSNEIAFQFLFVGTVPMHHSLFRDGAENIGKAFGSGGLDATDNNLTVSPQFVDSAGGNYQLAATSPAVDAGTPDTTGLHTGNTDVVGHSRIAGTAIDIGAYEFQASALPVDLTFFEGRLLNGFASLKWESGVETNLNRYILERATDGRNFIPVTSVSAKGSNSHYSYSLAQTQLTAYYRLHMLDNSGKSSFSKIVRLTRDAGAKVSVYPNPAEDYIYVDASAKGKIFIYNASGRLMKTEPVQTGMNSINVRSLSAGIYFIRINRSEVKFIKR